MLLTVGTTNNGQVPGLSQSGGNVTYYQLQFNVQDGYWITNFRLVADVGGAFLFNVLGYPQQWTYNDPPDTHNNFINSSEFFDLQLTLPGATPTPLNGVVQDNPNSFMYHAEGAQTVTFYFRNTNPASVSLLITQNPTDAAMTQWQSQVWSALYNAAQATYYAQQQAITAQISALQATLNGVDTLTLRREENDEIMKCVLRWLLGSGFEFMPQEVLDAFTLAGADLQYGVAFTGNSSGFNFDQPGAPEISIPMPPTFWTILGNHEEVVSFINQAIDWDSTLYYLYSYFWDVPPSWDFIRQIQHPDATRQAFLRAGSARVVLCVRQGWETAWTNFVEFWSTSLEGGLPVHPYLTIAQQIESYDSTNYPGIPAADPSAGPYDDNTPQVSTTSDATLPSTQSNYEIPVADNTGFVVGATAIIDSWASGVQATSLKSTSFSMISS